MSRIGACAVHEFAHALRNANVDHRGFSLADWVVSEGVSERHVIAVCGEDSLFLPYRELAPDVVDEATPRVVAAFDRRMGFLEMGTYVLGDAELALPPMIGYAVGCRIVEAFMRRHRASAADVVIVPTNDLVDAWNAEES